MRGNDAFRSPDRSRKRDLATRGNGRDGRGDLARASGCRDAELRIDRCGVWHSNMHRLVFNALPACSSVPVFASLDGRHEWLMGYRDGVLVQVQQPGRRWWPMLEIPKEKKSHRRGRDRTRRLGASGLALRRAQLCPPQAATFPMRPPNT